MSGTIQTIECQRDGKLLWIRTVWVPAKDTEAFYSRYHHTTTGTTIYTVKPNGKVCIRKPARVPHWLD